MRHLTSLRLNLLIYEIQRTQSPTSKVLVQMKRANLCKYAWHHAWHLRASVSCENCPSVLTLQQGCCKSPQAAMAGSEEPVAWNRDLGGYRFALQLSPD